MLYIIYQEDRADGAAIRAATREAHFAYLDRHKDILVLGGALRETFTLLNRPALRNGSFSENASAAARSGTLMISTLPVRVAPSS